MARHLTSTCNEGSNCHLRPIRGTVIAIASLAEGGHLLPIGDQGLEDFFGMKIALGEGVLKTDGVSTTQFMIFIEQEVQ